jgi:predicted metal-binding membrane protein
LCPRGSFDLTIWTASSDPSNVVENEMSVMIKKTMWILLAVTALAFALGTTVRADERKSNAVVPAIALDVTSLSLTDLQTVAIVAVAPDQKDAPIAAVLQTRSLANVAARVSPVGAAGVMHPVQKAGHATRLPQTASALPLIVLLSVVSIGVAFGLLMFGRRRASTA